MDLFMSYGLFHLADMSPQIVNPVIIMNHTVLFHLINGTKAIFHNEKR